MTNISRVVFASESCIKGDDDFGNIALGVELNRVITEGNNIQKHINSISDLDPENHTVN